MTWTLAALVLPTSVLAGRVAGREASGGGAARPVQARLESITTKADARMLAVLLEVSEPVPYAASQPDPLTVLVDLRGVSVAGVKNQVTAGRFHPVSAVTLEQAAGPDGVRTARVRVRLAEAVPYRVRSVRNVIRVEVERLAKAAATPAAARVAPPATAAVAVVESPNPLKIPISEEIWTPSQPPSPSAPASKTPPASASQGPPAAPPASTIQPPPPVEPGPAPATATQPPPPAAAGSAAPPAAAPQAGETKPAPQTPAPQVLGVQGRTDKQYTGNTISMDFGPSADLRAVLRVFGDQFGLNLLIDPSVKGTVDVQLRDVPWDQALDIILKSNQLGWSRDGTIVRIAPLTVLAEEETQRRRLADEQALGGDLGMVTRTLSYSKAEDMKALLEKGALTKRGQVQVDARTNTLIIRDLQSGLATAAEVMDTLDKAQPQVEIEARIVQTTKNFARQLGAQLGISARASPELGNTLPFAFPNSGSITGRTGVTQGPTTGAAVPSAVALAANPVTSALGLALGSVNGALSLDVALSALEKSGQGRVLSTPRVFAQNNVPAEITQGVQIPIQTVANNTVTVTFKDAALTLKVTPQINASGTVIMQITLENATPDYTKSINNIPPINTQRAITQVMVKDGQTAVVGGIYVSDEQIQNERTPGLGKIPVLGWLFKRDNVADESRELLIFITPKIVKG